MAIEADRVVFSGVWHVELAWEWLPKHPEVFRTVRIMTGIAVPLFHRTMLVCLSRYKFACFTVTRIAQFALRQRKHAGVIAGMHIVAFQTLSFLRRLVLMRQTAYLTVLFVATNAQLRNVGR